MMEINALLPILSDPARLFHVRTHDQLEVDGLIQFNASHLLVEVKSSTTISSGDAAPIEKWIALNPGHGPGIVAYPGTEYRRLSTNVRAMPVRALFG